MADPFFVNSVKLKIGARDLASAPNAGMFRVLSITEHIPQAKEVKKGEREGSEKGITHFSAGASHCSISRRTWARRKEKRSCVSGGGEEPSLKEILHEGRGGKEKEKLARGAV